MVHANENIGVNNKHVPLRRWPVAAASVVVQCARRQIK